MNERSTTLPYLVTGASGFVGRHLLGALNASEDGRPVLALVRDPEAWRGYDWTAILKRVQPVEGSVLDPSTWADDLPPIAGIFHLAAVVNHSRRDPEAMIATNVEGTLHMVRLAAAQRCRVVVLSTSGTVGCFTSPDARADEHAPYAEPTVRDWPYYRSKIEMERRARASAEQLGVELVFIRPPVLLGPGDHRLRSTRNVLRMLRGELPFLIRGGIHFCDVRDLAPALLTAMTLPSPRPIYHVPGSECTIQDFFARVAQVSSAQPPRLALPYLPAWLLARALERLHWLPDPVVVEMAAHYWGASSLYAERDLGYKSRDPSQTLRDTVQWLRDRGEAPPA